MNFAILRKFVFFNTIFILFVLAFYSGAVCADQQIDPISNLMNAAIRAAIRGPAKILLLDEATLDLPDNYFFVPAKEGSDIMRAMGNHVSPYFYGLVFRYDRGLDWMIMIIFNKSGYINTVNSNNFDSNKILSELKRLTDRDNIKAKKNGFPTIDSLRLSQPLVYDLPTNTFTWEVESRQSDENKPVYGYFQISLGRNGFFEMIFQSYESSSSPNFESAKKIFKTLKFNEGKRYKDYIPGKDHLSTRSLPDLVTGS